MLTFVGMANQEMAWLDTSFRRKPESSSEYGSASHVLSSYPFDS